ncbi:MAG TPA: serpin family protein [Planctomycetota bacterium]|nr:serpin family protein [Planctomycetota bacterium]
MTLLRSLCFAFLTPAIMLQPAMAQTPTDAQRLAAACNQFAADLHAKLSARGSPTSSPASISIALLMLLPAARAETAREIASMLHLPGDLAGERLQVAARTLLEGVGFLAAPDKAAGQQQKAEDRPVLAMTNDVWVQKGIELVPAYVELLRTSFAAGQGTLDFHADTEAARNKINAHIAKATNQRIAELLAPGVLTADTRVVLTNAVYFRGAWQHRFYPEATTKAPFHLASGTDVDVPTMRHTEHHGYAEGDEWQVLTMGFRSSRIVCDIVLPKKGCSLASAEATLRAGAYAKALTGESVEVHLPRFKAEATHSLPAPLQQLGMRAAFSQQADFSGMHAGTGPDDRFCVSEVVHKTWVAIDENGAEAAAATAVTLVPTSAAPQGPPKVFRADRPFAFVLRDAATGLVLFFGRVEDPRANQG